MVSSQFFVLWVPWAGALYVMLCYIKQAGVRPMETYLTRLRDAWKKTHPEYTHEQALEDFIHIIQELEDQARQNNYKYYSQYLSTKFAEAYELINSTVFYGNYASDLAITYGWLVGFVRSIFPATRPGGIIKFQWNSR